MMITTTQRLNAAQQENVNRVRQVYREIGCRNFQAVLHTLADDVDWRVMVKWIGGPEKVPYAGDYRGREEVARCFATLDSIVRLQGELMPTQYVVQGDRVMVTGQDMRRVVTTGELVENRWSMVWTFREGKVVKFLIYEDTVDSIEETV